MCRRSGFDPVVCLDAAGATTVSQAGAGLLVEVVRAAGLDRLLLAELGSGGGWQSTTQRRS